MAITVPYTPIQVVNAASAPSLTLQLYPLVPSSLTSTTLFLRGNLLVYSSTAGTLQRAAAGTVSAIVGVAEHDYNAQYYSGLGTGTPTPSLTSQFGANTSVPYVPPTDDTVAGIVIKIQSTYLLEGNLPAGTSFSQSLIGTSVGLNYDATSGNHYFDPAQSAIGTIQGLAGGPEYTIIGPNSNPLGGFGSVGDFGARVIVRINPGVLA